MAESVVQDTLIAAFKSFHTFHNKSKYFTWLCKIALNKLRDYYREQVHYRSKIVIPAIDSFNQIIDPKISAEEQLSLEELKQSVNSCLDSIPPDYRQLLHLRYYKELSTKEIGSLLKLSPRQIEGRLRRARLSLAKVVSTIHPEIKP